MPWVCHDVLVPIAHATKTFVAGAIKTPGNLAKVARVPGRRVRRALRAAGLTRPQAAATWTGLKVLTTCVLVGSSLLALPPGPRGWPANDLGGLLGGPLADVLGGAGGGYGPGGYGYSGTGPGGAGAPLSGGSGAISREVLERVSDRESTRGPIHVPEPTSGALLIIAIGLTLALRKKR